jgi:hypothetical protein
MVECGGLLIRCTGLSRYRGFESLPLRCIFSLRPEVLIGVGKIIMNTKEEISQPDQCNWVGLGIAITGGIVAAGSIYLCYYCFIQGYSKTSWLVIGSGLGLILAFCMLTIALIGGIRETIVRRLGRFWPITTIVISMVSLIGLVGISILGIIL